MLGRTSGDGIRSWNQFKEGHPQQELWPKFLCEWPLCATSSALCKCIPLAKLSLKQTKDLPCYEEFPHGRTFLSLGKVFPNWFTTKPFSNHRSFRTGAQPESPSTKVCHLRRLARLSYSVLVYQIHH